MKEISKTQKLQFAAIIIACILIFWAVGIVTNFFANPIFSMFFIVSQETAYSIVTYAAVIVAVALIIATLSLGLIKKGKITFPKIHNRPDISKIKPPVTVNPPSINPKVNKYLENYKTEQKNQSPMQPIMQPTKQSNTQNPTQQNTDKITANQETVINENRITCKNCKKELSRPLFSVDYSTGIAKIVRLCPYCNQSVDSQPKNTKEK